MILHTANGKVLLHSCGLNSSETAPFELGNGQTACLLLHGFTGSPWEVRPLGEYLAAKGYFVRAPRLPGHGTTPEAMEMVTYHDWLKTAEDELFALEKYGPVFIAGLSMGSLLALRLAALHPERVKGLALMAPAMQFRKAHVRWLKAMAVVPLLEFFKPRIFKAGSDIENARVRQEAPVMKQFPTSRLQDLFRVQELARQSLAQVKAPTLVLMAQRDHVVSVEGGREIERGLTNAAAVRFLALDKGFHILPRDHAKDIVLSEVAGFFDALLK